ncbi:MAG TPA: ABC transporter substrate-binding protein [Acetobacteraceae bacterium]|nr:ABC transporter substrate-binding protein [Acetobacteraceae bacterium]
MESTARSGVGRRTFVKGAVGLGAAALAAPPIIKARGEEPFKIGFIDPLTGVYSALAQSEVDGAKLAVDYINKNGGILGRQVQLLVEDSANDVGTGVQKAQKLINRDQVQAICGDVNSGIAYAITQVTNEHKVFQIVPGGHTDPITGKDCKWNVFRVCNTTSMDANAVSKDLIQKFGKRWYFITPDYAYGQTLQAAFIENLKKAGGEYQADLLPLNATDFSASLIKAKAYKANVLLNNMGGLSQIDCMKQFVQFGMDKEMALGGALYELESMLQVPSQALTGWWTYEWWWNQPQADAGAKALNDAVVKTYNRPAASARNWFGWVAIHSIKIAADKAKSTDAIKMARALEGEKLPDEVKCQQGDVYFRAGDHELMANIFVGTPHPAKAGANPADLVTVQDVVPGDQAALPVAETGCHFTWPTA